MYYLLLHPKENCVDFESRVVAKIDELISALEEKKSQLITSLGDRVASKLEVLNSQRGECSKNLSTISGLLSYTDEVSKEEDPAIFLLISSALCSRFDFVNNHKVDSHGASDNVRDSL